MNKKLSYRKHIARKLRTPSNNGKYVTGMTFKRHQGHWLMLRFYTAHMIS